LPSPAPVLEDDFESYVAGNLVGQGGWTADPGTTIFVGASSELLSNAVLGQVDPGTGLLSRSTRAFSGPLDASQVYEISFVARAQTTPIRSHNSGVYFHEGPGFSVMNEPSHTHLGWIFDARRGGGAATDTDLVPGGLDMVAQFTIVLDPVAGVTFGRYDFGGGPQETARFPFGPARLANIDGVMMIQDFRFGAVGVQIDDIQVRTVPVDVSIDIKPGGFPNPVNLRSQGTIPVAILTTAALDATSGVVGTSLTFGRTGDESSLSHVTLADVDRDGHIDIVAHFHTQSTGIHPGDTHGTLRGLTTSGRPIIGTDLIQTVPKR
jgi:hypothetical protein